MNYDRKRKEQVLMELDRISNPYRDMLAKKLEKNNKAYEKTAKVLQGQRKSSNGKSQIAHAILLDVLKSIKLQEAARKAKAEKQINNFHLTDDEIDSVLSKNR